MIEKCYTQKMFMAIGALMDLLFILFLYYSLGDFFIRSNLFMIAILYFTMVFIGFFSIYVNKVMWNSHHVIFYRWYFKKYRYNWEDIDGVYYCPKIGVVHMNISTSDGEFYPIPNVPDKLYKAIEKYAKVKIKIIRHPMEILPYLRERRKNMRKLRKNWRNS